MTNQKLDEQSSYLLAIQGILCESALLMNPLLERMLLANREHFSQEAKLHFNLLLKNVRGLAKECEFFEQSILPAARTLEGSEDQMSVYDSLVRDGYIMLRIACRVYNARMVSSKATYQIEQAIEMFNDGPRKLDQAIIESFRLQGDDEKYYNHLTDKSSQEIKDEDERTDTGGGSEPQE